MSHNQEPLIPENGPQLSPRCRSVTCVPVLRTRRFAPRTIPLVLLLTAICVAVTAAPAPAAQSHKKALFDAPLHHPKTGKSMFPLYKSMGVGIYQMQLNWNEIAPTRPIVPENPRDPAYNWPEGIGFAMSQARKHGMRLALQAQYTPSWANGGRDRRWRPNDARDFGRFLKAAARKYRRVNHWMIWGEPSRQAQFQPMPRLSSKGPRAYAKVLDAAYGALKSVRRSNRVIGGNTFTTGDVPPKQFVKSLKLPNGRSPRMNMWGHNPFTKRTPNLKNKPLPYGYADFSDLDTLARWLDRHQRRRNGRLPIYISEFTAPTHHANYEFDFWVTEKTQAAWLKAALRITRRWRRIYTMGWIHLYDQPPKGPNGRHGNEVHGGLIDWKGRRKPSFYAYKRG